MRVPILDEWIFCLFDDKNQGEGNIGVRTLDHQWLSQALKPIGAFYGFEIFVKYVYVSPY